MRSAVLGMLGVLILAAGGVAAAEVAVDRVETGKGPLEISFVGHGTLMFVHDGVVVHVDPWSRLADYATLPEADVILITHGHRDHLDQQAIEAIRGAETRIFGPQLVCSQVKGCQVLANGDSTGVQGLEIRAVPAYNLVHKRDSGEPFHPKGEGNGYVIRFGDVDVYVAGDTENVKEMEALKGIEVAFLPMNLPYTMTPEMVADAARAFRPKILYPYHFGDTDTARLVALLEKEQDIEVRVRGMK